MNIFLHTEIIALYGGALVVGMAIVPGVFGGVALSSFLAFFNRFETGRRDALFLPLTSFFVRRGTHPNTITLCGLALVVLLAAGFYRAWPMTILFGIGFFAAISDMVDGMLARAADKVSSFGGALDGVRDSMLFLVLIIGIIPLWSTALLSYVLVGVVLIECLKILEILVRAVRIGLRRAVILRARGLGKLSIDRVKFFLYCAACLGFLFEMGVFGAAIGIGSVILAGCVLVIAASVVLHAAVIVLELRGERFIIAEHT